MLSRKSYLTFLAIYASLAASYCYAAEIDREALFTRHNPRFTKAEPLNALSVGNGRFAFTADVTGLQTFTEAYAKDGIPLSAQSEWGWHSFPNEKGFTIEDTYQEFDTYGRKVPYPYLQHTEAGQWLRGNPHRIGLGTLGLTIILQDGSTASLSDIRNIDQQLDLWTATLTSRFEVEGVPVAVHTLCDPESDTIATRIESSLVESGRIHAHLRFAYGTSDWGIVPEDWSQPNRHSSELQSNGTQILRTLDQTRYTVSLTGNVSATEETKHRFSLKPKGTRKDVLEFAVTFSPSDGEPESVSYSEAFSRSQSYWPHYWKQGGVVDLSESSDPRAHELERRIVLSQYLTAIQCRGSLPPQETGLTFNSWYGKPHLEMHWWHATHFALWDRIEVVESALAWYERILPKAQAIASTQGYAGARWPKNVDKDGNQAPSTISPLLVWQQPHPIYFAELCYRQKPSRETLKAYREIVFETAAFLASYPHFVDAKNAYQLGPPLIPAQESYDATKTSNPPFELAYWRWSLETAQTWRERLGLDRDPQWQTVLEQIAPYPYFEDRYATAQDIWNDVDHPTVLAAFGMIDGPGIDRDRMKATLNEVMENWPWDHTWGWDYPMTAMTAARLGEPETAIEALLLDVQKNTYLPNGHNFQTQDRLRLYLPGNGGLLSAIAMMAAGWDGAPETHAPGFPQDGAWTVRWENLRPMP